MTPTFIRRTLTALILLCLVLLASTALAEEPVLTLSLESGFYDKPLPLEITCSMEGAQIYYTTDGSLPDETDLPYSKAIPLLLTTAREDPLSHITGVTTAEAYVPQQDFPSAHVIRAVAILPDGTRSSVVCGTYFVGYDRAKLYGDTPIMSLLIEPDDLFDHEKGIYVLGKVFDEWVVEQETSFESWQAVGNYSMRGREWERPVTVEYMPADGEGFTQDMGVRIKGGASRGNNQKSLRLIAREDYGEKNVKYELYPSNLDAEGKVIGKYKSFTLRCGGNDTDFAKIRDPYIANLARGMRFETACNLPCIAFINGEFWGIYTLNEEYTDKYVEEHYGIDNNNVVVVKVGELDEGEDSDMALYDKMFDFIAGGDMSDPDQYARACSMLDMGSFADFCALHLYIDNQDGLYHHNNWAMWRVRVPGRDDHPYADGKWRMMLYDTDFSSGVYDGGSTFNANTISTWLEDTEEYNWRHSLLLFRSLVRSSDFRQELITALCDVRNLYFAKTRATDLLDDMTADYHPYVPDTLRRFGPLWTTWDAEGHHKGNLNSIRTFFAGRYNQFPGLIRRAFDLSVPVTITIKTSNKALGSVYLNGRTIPCPVSCKAAYFKEYPITVTAVAADGARFTGWKVSSGDAVLSDASSETTEITFTGAFTLTALFEKE